MFLASRWQLEEEEEEQSTRYKIKNHKQQLRSETRFETTMPPRTLLEQEVQVCG